MGADSARRAGAVLMFNGADVSTNLFPYLKSVQYTDPASGASDEIVVTLYNCDLEWLKNKAPQLGDTIDASISLTNWNTRGDNHIIQCGSFLVDDVEFTGGPSECVISGVSKPADSNWAARERTQVWENVTAQEILSEVAGRNGLTLTYKGPSVSITKIEQSQRTDQAFVEQLCEDNDLGLKIYQTKLVVYDWGEMESQSPIAVLGRGDLEDDGYTYHATLAGIYTGAEIAYKNGDNDEEIKLTVGEPTRQMYINQTVDTAAEADRIARAQVNASNRQQAVLSADLWPRYGVTSGIVLSFEDMGIIDGLYFVDKMVVEVSGESGTRMSVETHRCQPRL